MSAKTEIKGLAASVQNTRRSIGVLRAEIAGLNADSWDLQKTVVELREQIKQTHDDLKLKPRIR
jgi:peptidoglycan hydrolase CwlO-like protein